MFRTLSISTFLVLFSLAGSAMAQDTPLPDDDRLDGAWEALLEGEGSFLSPNQLATLNGLAFQAAGVRLCEGHELDHTAFAKQIDAISAAPGKGLKEEQVEQRNGAIMVAFGARYGIFLAEGSLQTDRFCKTVADARKADNGAPVVLK